MEKIGSTLRGLEFYSGLGGFHYGTTLFNKMVQNTDYFVPNKDCGVEWYQNHLDNNPNVLRPVVESIYSNNATQYNLNNSNNIATTTSRNNNDDNINSSAPITPTINIIESFDINPIANQVYYHNFGRKVNTTDIGKLTVDQIRSYESNIWFISNPCQPFTIQNESNLDETDPRTNSFLHLLEVLDGLYNHEKPEFLVLENVENFELSYSYQILLSTLKKSNYSTISFILSPRQFGIPNQRSRFFLIASKIHEPLKPFRKLIKDGDKLGTNNLTNHDQSQTSSTLFPTPDSTPVQTIYKFVPTLHFIPPQFHVDYFNNNNNNTKCPQSGAETNEAATATANESSSTSHHNLDVYNSLWSDPDSAFDILRCTVKPPQRINSNAIDETGMAMDDTESNKNGNDDPNQLTPMAQREHNNTRTRIVKEHWLPRTIPAKIDQYLVNFDDLSEFSYTSFCKGLESTTQMGVGDQKEAVEVHNHGEEEEEERIGATTTTTTTTQEDSAEAVTTPTQSDPIESITNIHQLLLHVRTAEDVDDLTHISKKEKNKLKRLLVKSQKKAENQIKSTQPLTPSQLLAKNRKVNSDALSNSLNNAAMTKQNRLKAFLETSQSVALDPTTFLKSGVYTIDIVSPDDRSTCCFTKGYTSFFKGTGSILETFRPKKRTELFTINPSLFARPNQTPTPPNSLTTNDKPIDSMDDNDIIDSFLSPTPLHNQFVPSSSLASIISPTSPLSSVLPLEGQETHQLTSLSGLADDGDNLVYLSQNAPLSLRGLRYFLPREVANLQMLPPSRTDWDSTSNDERKEFPYFASFDWPAGITTKQKLKLLGNSLNSYIIANLLMVLLSRAPGTNGGRK